jgi:hypothetical protein
MTQARQNVRVSVTGAKARTIILPLKMTSACCSAPKTRRNAKSTIGSVAAAARWDATLSVPTIAVTIHLVMDRWMKFQANFGRTSRWPQGKGGAHRASSPVPDRNTRLLGPSAKAAGMVRL